VIKAVESLLRAAEPPTAIFATDDVIAILVINYLRRRGIRVPEDMSVVGYGNWAVSFVSDPSLATVAVPWAEMGRLGAERLIKLIEGQEANACVDILVVHNN
jgi:DNA-binding LacI/PurR family transcriptional regulator